MKRCIGTSILFIGIVLVCMQTCAMAQRRVAAIERTPSESSLRVRDLPDFFPLEVGNEWVYSDGVSNFTVRVLREIREANGLNYFEISGYFPNDSVTVRKVRRGPLGQILEFNPSGEDFLWYRFGLSRDPWLFETGDEVPCITGSQVITGSFGKMVDLPAGILERTLRLDFAAPCVDAGISNEYFAAGIGLVQRVSTTLAGPRTFKLVFARVGSLELPAAPYGIQVSMDRPVYFNNLMPPIVNPWPIARVMLVVRNKTETPVEFTFSTAQRFDFIVRDAFGEEVLRWSDGRMFAQVIGRERLINELRCFPAEIPLKGRDGKPLPAGFYTLVGYLTTEGSESGIASMLGVVAFEVRDLH